MNDLIPTNGRAVSARTTRNTTRSIARVQHDQTVLTAEETAKVEIIAEVTETALIATSHISALESFLMDRTPHAEARLKRIADAGTLGLSTVVLQATRRCQ
jgi:hypothetical protein